MRKIKEDAPDNSPANVKKAMVDSAKIGSNIRKPKQLTDKEINRKGNAIEAHVSEFLDAFILIGFGPNGEEYRINRASSPIEHRALQNLLDVYYNGENEGGVTIIGMGDDMDFEDDD